MVLRALGVPAPPARLDVPARGRSSRSGSSFWPRSRVLPHGVRAHVRRRSRRCSSPTATWRRSSAISRRSPGCRTDETARARHRRAARAALRRRRRGRTRRCGRRRRGFAAPSSQAGAEDDPPPLRPGRRSPPGSVEVLDTTRARTTPGGRRIERTDIVAPVRPLPTRRRTPCAGTRSRPTRTSSRASGRSACACRRRRRPRRTARAGRRRPSTSCAGCGSSRSRSRSARSASG